MRVIKLTIEYDGTRYCGWQIQHRHKGSPSIQEILQKVLQTILREKVRLVASGRTDAGVHALAQVAHFKTRASFETKKLQYALNGLLPDDIIISNVADVPADFHSRFNASSKTYRYTILNRAYPSALYRQMVCHCAYSLDINRMRATARFLAGTHDFASFRASASKVKDGVRTIKKISVKKEADFIYIDIEADGFLYNMVRSIVGTLIEVGRGRLSPQRVKEIVELKNRRLAGPTAPARGLCLMKVKYD